MNVFSEQDKKYQQKMTQLIGTFQDIRMTLQRAHAGLLMHTVGLHVLLELLLEDHKDLWI